MEEKGPECSRKRGSEVRSPSRSKTLKSRGHRGRSATTRRLAGNGKRVRCCGDTGLLGGSDVLRRVRAHRERRHGTTFHSCGSVSAGLHGGATTIDPVSAGCPGRLAYREVGDPRGSENNRPGRNHSNVGSGGRCRWLGESRSPNQKRCESCPAGNATISRAVQILNRRGGEKPRGRQSTCSMWWWQAYPSSEG